MFALLYLILLFYLWTAISVPQAPSHELNYNMLSDAFLNGHLHLPVNPSRELLALPNPYDPQQNLPYRLHDASLYDDKYYMYFGPAPALVLYAPFRLLTGASLPERMGVVVFSFAGLLFQLGTLRVLIRRYAPLTPRLFLPAAALVLGISNFVPFILRRPAIYEASIAAGYCFFAGGLYWLGRFATSSRHPHLNLVMASVFMGLTIGSRPHYTGLAIPIGLACLYILSQRHEKVDRAFCRVTAALALPALVLISAVLVYNHSRFDDWMEFGVRYQLSGSEGLPHHRFIASHVWTALKTYFVGMPVVNDVFPFFHPWLANPPDLPGLERVTGLLYSTPVIAVALVLSPLLILRTRTRGLAGPAFISAAFAAVGLTGALVISLFGVTARYMVDFVPALLMASIWVWIGLHASAVGSDLRQRLCDGVFIVTSFYGIVFHLAISLAGYYDTLERCNPGTYEWIKSWFAA